LEYSDLINFLEACNCYAASISISSTAAFDAELKHWLLNMMLRNISDFYDSRYGIKSFYKTDNNLVKRVGKGGLLQST
jgi:hypothetical protein